MNNSQNNMEARARQYREFMQWSIRTIADSLIQHGFKELESVVERILQAYRTMTKDWPQ